MKVKWLGHACFLITAGDGTRIITDPYAVGAGINYGKIEEAADIVVITHKHFDHYNPRAVKGKPQEVTESKKVKGIEFKGVKSFHDTSGGGERGPNTIFCFTVGGIRFCHLGDLGHELSPKQVSEIGEVDVLFIPVGGFYTIDARTAQQVCQQINPWLIFPMHYRTAKCDVPISGVDDFIKGMPKVRKVDATEVELKKAELPEAAEVMVLKHAL